MEWTKNASNHMLLQWIESLLDNLLRVATKLLFEEGTTFKVCESACLWAWKEAQQQVSKDY